MAHASTHTYDHDPDQALEQIKAERTRKSWIALILFALAAIGVAGSIYLSHRELQPASPANDAPGLADPYH